jgi:hypothetical protein
VEVKGKADNGKGELSFSGEAGIEIKLEGSEGLAVRLRERGKDAV